MDAPGLPKAQVAHLATRPNLKHQNINPASPYTHQVAQPHWSPDVTDNLASHDTTTTFPGPADAPTDHGTALPVKIPTRNPSPTPHPEFSNPHPRFPHSSPLFPCLRGPSMHVPRGRVFTARPGIKSSMAKTADLEGIRCKRLQFGYLLELWQGFREPPSCTFGVIPRFSRAFLCRVQAVEARWVRWRLLDRGFSVCEGMFYFELDAVE